MAPPQTLATTSTSFARLSLRRGFLLLAVALSSCSDSIIPPEVASEKPKAVTEAVLLDEALLRDAGQQMLSLGANLNLAYDSTGTFPINSAALEIGDTSVVALGAGGVLQSRKDGSAWLRWPYAGGTDSALVIVGTPALQESFASPLPPAKTVDVRYPTGRSRGSGDAKTWRVEVGGDLQGALNAARPGDEVVLAQGATFTGNFVLPIKSAANADWIVVRSEILPVASGSRITPTLAQGVAKIETPNQDPAIVTAKGARRWRLVGFEVAHQQGAIYNYGILVLGWGNESSINDMPSEIVLDRMYIHGSPTEGNSRCVAFNGRSLAVINSWLAECHASGQDAQGVWGSGGPGPFLIENNRIEASGQAVMFGGADPLITNLSPSDITIRRNHFFKPLTWAKGKWTVKATFELKHARRVLFENNVLENHWADAQEGYAILFQAVSQSERAPWSTVEDVMVRNNIIRNSTGGAVVLARYSQLIASPTSRVAFLNNLWDNVGRDPISGSTSQVFLLLGALRDVTIANNTVTLPSEGTANSDVYFDGFGGARTTIINNLFPRSVYGVAGSGIGSGSLALAAFAIGGTFSGNVIPAMISEDYPPNNFFPEVGPQPAATTTSTTGVCDFVQTWLTGRQLASSIGASCATLEAANAAVVPDRPPQ